MKKLILLIGIVMIIFVSGCIYDNYYEQGYTQGATNTEFTMCGKIKGHRWDNNKQSCELLENPNDCITLNSLQRIDVIDLPNEYKNITFMYYDDNVRIRPFCTNGLIRTENQDCEISYYEIEVEYEKNKTICWN